jgi:iron complex transport system ATP-binding protein
MAFVEARGLDFDYYRGTKVLSGVDLDAGRGQLSVCIGPNGAGKSTLLRLLAGWLSPQQGQIKVNGQGLDRLSRRQVAREVAVLEQDLAAAPRFQVWQMVLLGRAPFLGPLGLETKEDRKLASQAMEFTQVQGLAKRRLDQLSSGERQRVHLARALCQRPRLLLLDEPTTALDPAHQVRIMDLLLRLCREQGLCVILVSHDLNLAGLYADQVLLLKAGAVIAQGRAQEVLRASRLRQAYGCSMLVETSSLGLPLVTPLPERYLD